MKQYRIILKDFETNRIYLDWVEVPPQADEQPVRLPPEPPRSQGGPARPQHQGFWDRLLHRHCHVGRCVFESERGGHAGWFVWLACRCGKVRLFERPKR